MLRRLTAPLAAIAISTAAAALLAGAAALPIRTGPPAAPAAASDVELVHGCHRGIQRDRGGWHFHDRACLRGPVPPPGLYDVPAYRHFYRGPLCTYQCRFIGPVKTCQQVCR